MSLRLQASLIFTSSLVYVGVLDIVYAELASLMVLVEAAEEGYFFAVGVEGVATPGVPDNDITTTPRTLLFFLPIYAEEINPFSKKTFDEPFEI
jgi:hypothetical protein